MDNLGKAIEMLCYLLEVEELNPRVSDTISDVIDEISKGIWDYEELEKDFDSLNDRYNEFKYDAMGGGF